VLPPHATPSSKTAAAISSPSLTTTTKAGPTASSARVDRILAYEQATGADLVICHAARRQYSPDGRTVYEPALGMDMTPGPHGQPLIDLFLLGRPIWGPAGKCATCSQMARCGVYRSLGGFDEDLRRGEDSEFNLRLALAGGHITRLSDELVTQEITISADKRFEEQCRNARYLVEMHRGPLSRCSWYRFTVVWLEMKYD